MQDEETARRGYTTTHDDPPLIQFLGHVRRVFRRTRFWFDRDLPEEPLHGWRYRAHLLFFLGRRWVAVVLLFYLFNAVGPGFVREAILFNAPVDWVAERFCQQVAFMDYTDGAGIQRWCIPLGGLVLYNTMDSQLGEVFLVFFLVVTTLWAIVRWILWNHRIQA